MMHSRLLYDLSFTRVLTSLIYYFLQISFLFNPFMRDHSFTVHVYFSNSIPRASPHSLHSFYTTGRHLSYQLICGRTVSWFSSFFLATFRSFTLSSLLSPHSIAPFSGKNHTPRIAPLPPSYHSAFASQLATGLSLSSRTHSHLSIISHPLIPSFPLFFLAANTALFNPSTFFFRLQF